MEGLIIRRLDASELDFVCRWIYCRFEQREFLGGVENGEDVLQILDQLYFYRWSDHIVDIWVNRANFCAQPQVNVFVYTKDPAYVKDPSLGPAFASVQIQLPIHNHTRRYCCVQRVSIRGGEIVGGSIGGGGYLQKT